MPRETSETFSAETRSVPSSTCRQTRVTKQRSLSTSGPATLHNGPILPDAVLPGRARDAACLPARLLGAVSPRSGRHPAGLARIRMLTYTHTCHMQTVPFHLHSSLVLCPGSPSQMCTHHVGSELASGTGTAAGVQVSPLVSGLHVGDRGPNSLEVSPGARIVEKTAI